MTHHNVTQMLILGYKIGMLYHPDFEESLWDFTYIGEIPLGYAESTVRTNLVGVGRQQASKAWENICNKVEERGSAYYARLGDVVNSLEDTIVVGDTKFRDKAESLLNRYFLVELENAWSTVMWDLNKFHIVFATVLH